MIPSSRFVCSLLVACRGHPKGPAAEQAYHLAGGDFRGAQGTDTTVRAFASLRRCSALALSD